MSGNVDPLAHPSLLALPEGQSSTSIGQRRAAADGSVRVVAEGVAKSFGSVTVLRGIDVSLGRRSLVAIAGSNGVGKSTLLGCLAGTLRHSGRVLVDGKRVGPATRSRIAYLPQRLRLPPASSGREVLRLFAALARSVDGRVDVPEGFLPDVRKPIGQLSGGQAQRVALTAVLQGRPDLVLLDEPFANLDDESRTQVHHLLQAHRDAGATVLVASPTALDLLAITDRVLLLEDGLIAFDGAPARYAGRLEMTLWVRPGACDADCLASLDHVLRSRREGDWLLLECHEDHAIGLLRDLEAAGVPSDRVKIGGLTGDARVSESPGSSSSGSAR